MKKLLTMLLCLVLCFSAVACGGTTEDGPDGNQVVIEFFITDGGVGSDWLAQANTRFMDANVATQYGEKTGVYCRINKGQPSLNNMSSDGYHVYFMDRTNPVAGMAKTGNLLNIDAWVNEEYEATTADDERDANGNGLLSIREKMYEEYAKFPQADNGDYYGIPYMEVYGGLTYDRKLFNDNNLYFAQKGTGSKFNCQLYGTNYEFYQSKNPNSKKTPGPDGVEGTVDDGLPSCVLELVTLWEKMRTLSIEPVQLSGKYLNYADFFLDGVWTALQGEQRAYTTYSLNGEVEVVVGYENEPIFGQIDYIKKPKTAVVNITEESGYYTSWSVEKYYALALLEIIEKQGYFTTKNKSQTYSHIDCQQDFIYSGYGENKKIGMLIEASYWYNESKIRNNFNYFNALYPEAGGDRDIQWMSLPVNLYNQITGEEGTATNMGVTETVKGERPTLIDTSRSAIVFNSKVEQQPEVLAALKDWVLFFNSDEELSYFTIESGLARPLNYQVKEAHREGWNQFHDSLWELRKDCYVLRFEGNNATFYGNTTFFARGFTDGAFSCHSHLSAMECYRSGAHGTKAAFEYGMRTKTQYGAMYQGTGTITDVNGVVYNG